MQISPFKKAIKSSLLVQAWEAGTVSRLTVILGLILSAGWAFLIGFLTLSFIGDTLRDPAIASAYKVPLLVVLAAVMLILVIPIPATWLMYALLRLDERRRSASHSK